MVYGIDKFWNKKLFYWPDWKELQQLNQTLWKLILNRNELIEMAQRDAEKCKRYKQRNFWTRFFYGVCVGIYGVKDFMSMLRQVKNT
jgi:hypothetical protein